MRPPAACTPPGASVRVRGWLVAVAGLAVAAFAAADPDGGWVLAAFGFALAASAGTLARVPRPSLGVEGAVLVVLTAALGLEIARTGDPLRACAHVLAVVQGLASPRAEGRLPRASVAAGAAAHLLAAGLWTDPAFGSALLLAILPILLGVSVTACAAAHLERVAGDWEARGQWAAAAALRAGLAPGALARRAAPVAGLALALGGIAFVAIPRPEADEAGPGRTQSAGRARRAPPRGPAVLTGGGGGRTGFRDRVDFSDLGPLHEDARVAMRVTVAGADGPVAPPPEGLLLRGVAFNRYEGRSWRAAGVATRSHADAGDGRVDGWTHAVPGPIPRGAWRLSLDLVDVRAAYVFHVGRLLAAEVPALVEDGNGTIALPAPSPARYQVVTLPSALVATHVPESPPGPEMLHLPGGPSARKFLDELLAEIAPGPAPPDVRAAHIAGGLGRRYRASFRLPRLAPDIEPLAAFLRGRMPGHCEFFASAMVCCCRAAGIPARLVGGFRSDEWDAATGVVTVRHRHAHAWVEAWLPGRGWIPFDPTPASADPDPTATLAGDAAPGDAPSAAAEPGALDRLLAFGAAERAAVLRYTGGVGGLLLVAAGLSALAGMGAWRRARRVAAAAAGESPPARAVRVPDFYAGLLAALARAGFRRQRAQTPRELAADVRRAGAPVPEAVEALTRAFEDWRYGGRPILPERRAALQGLVGEVRRAARTTADRP